MKEIIIRQNDDGTMDLMQDGAETIAVEGIEGVIEALSGAFGDAEDGAGMPDAGEVPPMPEEGAEMPAEPPEEGTGALPEGEMPEEPEDASMLTARKHRRLEDSMPRIESAKKGATAKKRANWTDYGL